MFLLVSMAEVVDPDSGQGKQSQSEPQVQQSNVTLEVKCGLPSSSRVVLPSSSLLLFGAVAFFLGPSTCCFSVVLDFTPAPIVFLFLFFLAPFGVPHLRAPRRTFPQQKSNSKQVVGSLFHRFRSHGFKLSFRFLLFASISFPQWFVARTPQRRRRRKHHPQGKRTGSSTTQKNEEKRATKCNTQETEADPPIWAKLDQSGPS